MPLTNIFDCFADGVFENLPASDAGSLTFTVTIFAYNQDAVRRGRPAGQPRVPPDAGRRSVHARHGAPHRRQKKLAPWTTTCTATQQQGTPVVAVCGPLREPATRARRRATDRPTRGCGDAGDAAPPTRAPADDAADDARRSRAATPPTAPSRPTAGPTPATATDGATRVRRTASATASACGPGGVEGAPLELLAMNGPQALRGVSPAGPGAVGRAHRDGRRSASRPRSSPPGAAAASAVFALAGLRAEPRVLAAVAAPDLGPADQPRRAGATCSSRSWVSTFSAPRSRSAGARWRFAALSGARR